MNGEGVMVFPPVQSHGHPIRQKIPEMYSEYELFLLQMAYGLPVKLKRDRLLRICLQRYHNVAPAKMTHRIMFRWN